MKNITKNLIVLFLLFSLTVTIIAQKDTLNEIKDVNNLASIKAKEIISQYFSATGLNKSDASYSKLGIILEKTREVQKSQISTNEAYYFYGNLLRHENKSDKSDQVRFSRIAVLNNGKFYRDYEVSNGSPDSRRATFTKEQELLDGEVRLLKWNSFVASYPILLEASWYPPIDLKYLGVAESEKGRASVLEGKLGKNRVLQLLFDVKSHLLDMWKITTIDSKGKETSIIYYFSDYKVISGVKIATKIEIYQDGEINETRFIKKFDTDPTFPNDFFELK